MVSRADIPARGRHAVGHSQSTVGVLDTSAAGQLQIRPCEAPGTHVGRRRNAHALVSHRSVLMSLAVRACA